MHIRYVSASDCEEADLYRVFIGRAASGVAFQRVAVRF